MLLTLYCIAKVNFTLYIFSRIFYKREHMYNAKVSTFTVQYIGTISLQFLRFVCVLLCTIQSIDEACMYTVEPYGIKCVEINWLF